MYEHMGFGLGFLNFIGTILFFVAIIWALKYFARGGCRGRRHDSKWRDEWRAGRRPWERQDDEAEKVMRERLAKGEINEDEYAQLKARLGGNGGYTDANPLRWLRGDDAMEVARLRLAKGAITPEEFETIRRALGS